MKALKSFGQTPESWIPARRAHSLSNDEYRVRVHRVHRIPCSISCSGTSMFVQPQMGSMKSSSTHLRRVMVSATDSTAAMPAPESTGKDWKTAIGLTLLFGGWYLANIYFNIYNKQVLAAFPYPLTLTTIQFAIGSLLASFAWTIGLQPRPVIPKGALRSIIPLAGIHVVGNMLTNVSLRAVAVSFTHTVKAMEPAFSVMMSAGFLGYRPSLAVVASLIPIISGVALASTSELTFNWVGFLAAMGSNLTFQSRNVLSKKFMLKGKAGLDNINLFSIITIMAFFILAPIAIAVEGVQVTPAALAALPEGILRKALVAGLTFHAYQQISYLILQRVSPVTHAVGNCIKRVVVIVASVVAFNTAITQQNAIGTALALTGVFLYSRAKQSESNKK